MKVSKGTQKKTVPNVVGQADADAQNAIKAAGLTVGTVTYEFDAVSYTHLDVYKRQDLTGAGKSNGCVGKARGEPDTVRFYA